MAVFFISNLQCVNAQHISMNYSISMDTRVMFKRCCCFRLWEFFI